MSVPRYIRLGLERVGLDPDVALDRGGLESMLGRQQQVVGFFSLALLLAPVVETLLLLDRMIYLQEQGEGEGPWAGGFVPPGGGGAQGAPTGHCPRGIGLPPALIEVSLARTPLHTGLPERENRASKHLSVLSNEDPKQLT